MNMKRIQIILAALVLSVSVSCTADFLDVDPTTEIPEKDYYDDYETLLKGLMAAYAPLQWPDFVFGEYGPLTFVSDVMSDDVRVGGANETDIPYLQLMRKFSATPNYTPSVLWVVFYSGVYRANTVLQYVDTAEGMSGSTRSRIKAEAYVLRAYYYTWLWKLFGNVPYYERNPTGPDYLIDQLTADGVYAKIIGDLDAALTGSGLPKVVKSAELGRFTRAAAQMLRANVVMYQQDASRYATVLTDMREIIGSGLYSLRSDFAGLWTDSGEWGSESIFEVNYTDSPSSRTWENPTKAGGTVFPTLIGINGYSGPEWDTGGYGFEPVEEALYNAYEGDDTRRDATILNFAKYRQQHPEATYTPRYDDTGYFNRKYLGRADGHDKYTGNAPEMNFRNNYRVWRYAETLLIASELIVRTNGDQDEADGYLNQVRARAFGMKPDDAAFAAKRRTATLDNLLLENRLEFALEGHRFWDLVRCGKAGEVLGSRGYTDAKKHLPIPQSEIDQAHGTLKQNPY
jgi:hypothetical protein